MRVRVVLAALLLGAGALASAADTKLPTVNTSPLRFALLKTGTAKSPEAMAVSGGRWFTQASFVHSAVYVQHPTGSFLYDTGLGAQVDAQFKAEMPWWAKPLMPYEVDSPARQQLADAKLPLPERIFLSHGHWDHVSGLIDFPDAEIWITAEEKNFLATGKPPAVLPSQVNAPQLRWRQFELLGPSYAGFAQSLDVFGDGSAILVGMPGHTPGSLGLFLTSVSGKHYFFIGDTAWHLRGVTHESPKFPVARKLADSDPTATLALLKQIHALQLANPDLIVVPAHDAAVQDAVGYFPNWVE
ncbi:MAG: MBL fold metallo-hydrolase [Nevskiales bacterium]